MIYSVTHLAPVLTGLRLMVLAGKAGSSHWPLTPGFPYLDKGGTAQRREWGRERRVGQGIS